MRGWTVDELKTVSEAMKRNGFPNYEEFCEELGLKPAPTCPVCGRMYFERPALSRRDNRTQICPDCGIQEAMDDFQRAKGGSSHETKES